MKRYSKSHHGTMHELNITPVLLEQDRFGIQFVLQDRLHALERVRSQMIGSVARLTLTTLALCKTSSTLITFSYSMEPSPRMMMLRSGSP